MTLRMLEAPRARTALRWAPVVVFLVLQVLRVTLTSPDYEFRADAAHQWSLARSLAAGDPSAFDVTGHHDLRWANWLPAYFANLLFSDDLTLYLLCTVIASTLAGLVFVALASFAAGPGWALLLAGLWMVDQQLWQATFKLMPTGQALLPLALVCAVFWRCAVRETLAGRDAVLLAVLCFWLYAVKETHLFFVPGVVAVLWRYAGLRTVALFAGAFAGLYVMESLVLWLWAGAPTPLGRMYELVFGSSRHLGRMGSERIARELAGFYDGGWSFRYYQAEANHTVLYFVAALLAAMGLARGGPKAGDRTASFLWALSALYLAFFALTAVFIIGFDPLVPGQPMRARYLAVMLPLGYLLIALYLHMQLRASARWVAAPLLLILWLYASMPLQFTLKQYRPPHTGLEAMDAHYARLSKAIERVDCVVSDKRIEIDLVRRMVPAARRGPAFERFASSPIREEGNNVVVRLNERCDTRLRVRNQRFRISGGQDSGRGPAD